MVKVSKVTREGVGHPFSEKKFPVGSVFCYYDNLYLVMNWRKGVADVFSFACGCATEIFVDSNENFIPASLQEVKYSV